MPTGIRLRFRSASAKMQGERVLVSLPIRIGRNPLNDCHLPHGWVSDFHACLELVDGQLCVRDLGSKNGVFSLSGARLPPNTPVPLAQIQFGFGLTPDFQIQVETFEQQQAVGARIGGLHGTVVGNRAALETDRPPAAASVGPRPGPAPSRSEPPPAAAPIAQAPPRVMPLPPLSVDMRPSPHGAPSPLPPQPALHGSQPPQPTSDMLPPLPPVGALGGAAPDPRAAHASSAPPPAMAAGAPPPGKLGTQLFSFSVEAMALLGLQELAGSLVPGQPLQTTGDVARLLTKLHDTVEVFCRCFVPLRDGYSQFVSEMDLRRAASQRSVNRSRSALQIEVAKDPAAVAAALLDWRNQDYDAPRAVESIFADLMMHQLALVEGVMQGVKTLLDELSPERIEQLQKDEPAGAMSAVLGRYRALWKTYQARYDELANEARTFELVFGSDFAASYREYMARRERS